MQQQTLAAASPAGTHGTDKKPFTVPALRREARVALVTAGSFDLILPPV